MPTNQLNVEAAIDKLAAVLDAGEVLAETVRSHVSRSMRSQMLGRPHTMSRSEECLLYDTTEAWRECAESLECDLAALAATLSAIPWLAAR